VKEATVRLGFDDIEVLRSPETCGPPDRREVDPGDRSWVNNKGWEWQVKCLVSTSTAVTYVLRQRFDYGVKFSSFEQESRMFGSCMALPGVYRQPLTSFR
jgi:hypothetical protein